MTTSTNIRPAGADMAEMPGFHIIDEVYVPEHMAEKIDGWMEVAYVPSRSPAEALEAEFNMALYARLGVEAGKQVESLSPDAVSTLKVAEQVFTREDGYLVVVCGDCDFRTYSRDNKHSVKVHLCHVHTKSVEDGNVDAQGYRSRTFISRDEAARQTKLLKQAVRVFSPESSVSCVDCSLSTRRAINGTVGIEFTLCAMESDDMGGMPRPKRKPRQKMPQAS